MDWLAVVGLTVDGIRGGRRTSSWTVVGVAGLAVGLKLEPKKNRKIHLGSR